jgi:MFS family permease
METLILGWYILVETGSVLLLTIFAALYFVGTLVAPVFGLIGDRIGHRDLLAGMRVFYMAQAAILTVLIFTGLISPLYVFIIALMMGMVRPSDLGVRGALVATTMPHDQLVGALSISRTTMDTARIAGALTGAGLFAILGMGPAYLVILTIYAIATSLTLCIRPSARHQPGDDAASEMLHPSPLRDLKEGLAYVWHSPRMQASIWIAVLVNLTAYPLSGGLLPYIAREVYGANSTALGYLSASFAAGSLVGSVGLGLVGGVRVARLMIAATLVWYVSLLVFAQVQTVNAAIVCLMSAGFAQSLAMISLSVILMRTANEHLRGRVMGIRMMAIYTLPLGLLAAGNLIGQVGFTTTATLYAASGLLLLLIIALRWRGELLHLHAPANAK